MAALDTLGFILSLAGGDGGGGGQSGLRVGVLKQGDSFPTVRPSGDLLENDDYVSVASNAILPFTIGNVTFNTKSDTAFYFEGEWNLKQSAPSTTDKIGVSNPINESLSGTAHKQSEINAEFVTKIKNIHIDEKVEQAQQYAAQAGTYSLQAGNSAAEAINAKDLVEKRIMFFETMDDYNAAVAAGIVIDGYTYSFISTGTVVV